MSSRRNRERGKSSLLNLKNLPRVSYEEVAEATFGSAGQALVNRGAGETKSGGPIDSDIEDIGDGAIRAYDYRLTGLGLDPAAMPNQERKWRLLGQLLFRLDRSMQWLIGDWLLQGEANHWGKHEEIADKLGYDVTTLYDYRYVARNVHFSVRTEILSFGHHKLVAHLEADAQRYWLNKAAEGDRDDEDGGFRPWSISRLRGEMRDRLTLDAKAETAFERNLRRIDRELTRKKWNNLPVEERRKRYEGLRAVLDRMTQWGLD